MRLRVFKQLSQINILREEEVQDLKATVLEFFFLKKVHVPYNTAGSHTAASTVFCRIPYLAS